MLIAWNLQISVVLATRCTSFPMVPEQWMAHCMIGKHVSFQQATGYIDDDDDVTIATVPVGLWSSPTLSAVTTCHLPSNLHDCNNAGLNHFKIRSCITASHACWMMNNHHLIWWFLCRGLYWNFILPQSSTMQAFSYHAIWRPFLFHVAVKSKLHQSLLLDWLMMRMVFLGVIIMLLSGKEPVQ